VATQRCQTYVAFELIDQNTGFMNTLFTGYVTSQKPLSYPPINIEDSFSGRGILRSAEIVDISPSIVVQPNRLLRLDSFRFNVTTGAVAGNRMMFLGISIAGTDFMRVYSPELQTASMATVYCGWIFGNTYGAPWIAAPDRRVHIALPDIILLPANEVNFLLWNRQAGDAGTLDYLYEEWLTL
jgi:hypothetical protein